MITSALNPDVVKTYLDSVFNAEFGYEVMPGVATAEDPLVFMQESVDRQSLTIDQFQGVGYFAERAEMGNLDQATPLVGNTKVFSVVNYAKEVDISKNFFDDDQHTTIEKMIKSMARNARLSRDKNAFEQYNLGFTTTLSNDAVALFSNSHVTLAGDTVDNLETGVLSEANLDVSIQSLELQLTQDGTLGGHAPACLLLPPALFKKGMEITKSALRQGTGNNDMNYYSELYPGLIVKRSPFLSAAQGGSDTAWFLLSRDHSMFRWTRQALVTDMIDYKYQRNNAYVYKAEYREMVGPISFEGMVGSNGSV